MSTTNSEGRFSMKEKSTWLRLVSTENQAAYNSRGGRYNWWVLRKPEFLMDTSYSRGKRNIGNGSLLLCMRKKTILFGNARAVYYNKINAVKSALKINRS